jgi:hypothetical protein
MQQVGGERGLAGEAWPEQRQILALARDDDPAPDASLEDFTMASNPF